jgi:DNA-directed RNA polymerase subunit beta'
MIKGVTIRQEVNKETGIEEIIVTEHKHDRHPQIVICNPQKDSEILSFSTIPSQTHVMVKDNDMVPPATSSPRPPRQFTKTKDITGGLPRVASSSRRASPSRPPSSATLTHVELKTAAKGMRQIVINPPVGKPRE